MHDIFDEIKTLSEQGIAAVLCIVTATTGSTPRKSGSKMIVHEDGSITGTIGGGSIEYQVIKDAMGMMSGGNPVTKRFHLENDMAMHCGGTMEIYFEPFGNRPKLYIFGGGHIGKALAGYATGLGFVPCVFDQREDIFDSWDQMEVVTRTGDYIEIIESLEFDSNTYIAIVTPKHEFDEKVLFACLPHKYAYLGMIGSKRKVAEIKKKALETKVATAEELDKVDMPIGIPFAAETPAEIAISIIAKMIDVKNSLKKL